MNEVFYFGAGALFVGGLLYWRRQVRKRLDQANTPFIPKTPTGIEPRDDFICFHGANRSAYLSRSVAKREQRDT